MRQTFEGSFWSMTTTLLGFLSLLIATARPLRELGMAGAIGTLMAMAVAYGVYPAFLGSWARARGAAALDGTSRLHGSPALVAGIGVLVAAFALGVPRIDTDPSLLGYFSERSEIREGLDRIDADGGTSTLDIVVRAGDGGRVDTPATFAAMESLETALEADSAVGVVLSPTVLIGHARTLPFASLLPVSTLLDIASSDRLNGVALGYVTPARDQARFSLRMRERVGEARAPVMERLAGLARREGLEPVVMAGLYDLQAQLGRLIASSLRVGIGGLLALFLVVALVVSRSFRTALRMWVCLIGIPLVILGTFGHAGIAIDIITSPSANIALGIGADSMIHLVVRVRTLAAAGSNAPWADAVAQIGRPVLGASSIICAGFGIFVLSSFPPTQRFGLAVIVGTVAAATLALVVLPRIAAPAAKAA
jgi:predicted RND superfamily exporter protein